MKRRRFLKLAGSGLFVPAVCRGIDLPFFSSSGGGNGGNGLLTNLVGYWTMDEDASTDKADSVGSNTLVRHGLTSSPTGKLGHCVGVGGAAANIFLAPASSTTFAMGSGVSFTFGLWVQTITGAITQPYISKWVSSFEYLLYNANPNLTWQANDVSSNNVSIDTGVNIQGNLNTWYYIVCGWDASSSKLFISVNGGAKQTATLNTGVMSGSDTFEVLNFFTNAGLNDLLVDELALWKNRALSSSDISALYNGGSGLAFSSFTS